MLLLFLLSIFSVMLIIVYLLHHPARRGRDQRLHGDRRCAPAQTRLSRLAGGLESPWRSDRARRPEVARFHDEKSRRRISHRCARSRKRKARGSPPICTIGSPIWRTSRRSGRWSACSAPSSESFARFGALGSELGPTRYVALSKGISEALINTCGGLGIGITAMIFYAIFRGRAQRLVSDLESASTHIVALLSLQQSQGAGNALRCCSKMNFERR